MYVVVSYLYYTILFILMIKKNIFFIFLFLAKKIKMGNLQQSYKYRTGEQITAKQTKYREKYNHPNLSLNFYPRKYSGIWLELARYPLLPWQTWEENCLRSKTEYTWDKKEGILRIKNTCYTKLPQTRKVYINKSFNIHGCHKTKTVEIENTGESYILEGIGTIPNKKKPRKINVKFNTPPWDKYETEEPNYLILETDYDNYSIVVGPYKRNLWILTRSYSLSKKEGNKIINIIKNLDCDPDLLTAHSSAIDKNTTYIKND